MLLHSFFAGAALLLAVVTAPATAAEITAVEVESTEFKVTMSDGSVLRSPDLIGADLTISVGGEAVPFRIEAVEPDPSAKRGPVWLHTLSTKAADGSWQNTCDPGPDGRRQAFPLTLRTRTDGTFEPTKASEFVLTCTGGAMGKCVRFGYLPWSSEADRALYNACVRMARADYCGNGIGTTRNGMLIDLYDVNGIQKPENNAPEFQFEAGWSPAGAVCVHHTRVPENATLETLARTCPNLAQRLGAQCTEESARSAGGLLFNRSKIAPESPRQ